MARARPGRGTSRGSTLGTCTTASEVSRSWPSSRGPACEAATARLSDLLRRCGNGWPGSIASGVSAGKTVAGERGLRAPPVCSGVSSSRRASSIPSRASSGRISSSRQIRYCVDDRVGARSPIARELLGRATGRRAGSSATPPVSCCLRPATRTMKNSSRFEATIARNFSRSSSGSRGVARLVEDALVEREPGELAVDEELAVAGSRRSGATVPPWPPGQHPTVTGW